MWRMEYETREYIMDGVYQTGSVGLVFRLRHGYSGRIMMMEDLLLGNGV